MSIDKLLQSKGLNPDCVVESDINSDDYVQHEVRDLIKRAVDNERYRIWEFICKEQNDGAFSTTSELDLDTAYKIIFNKKEL